MADEKVTEAKEASVVVQSEFVTAQVVPIKRNITAILKEAVDIAELSGDLFYYRWETSSTNKETGEKTKGFVCGQSVKLTNEAARLFGNCLIQQLPVQSTATAWIFTTAFVDLETGFTRQRQFRMSKNAPVHGRMDKFRKEDIRFQIGQSKSDRNVVMNSLPQIITDKMLKAALASVRKQVEFRIKNVYGGDSDKAVVNILKKFGEYGVVQADIERRLGLKRAIWDLDTLVMFMGDIKALESGEQTATTLYGETEPDATEKPKNGLSIDTAAMGDPNDHQSVKRDESASPEQEEKRELTKKEQFAAKLIAMSGDEKYNTVPGLKASFKQLSAKIGEMSEKEMENAIANIEDVRLKHEKAQKKEAKKGDQGKLM